MKLVSLFAILFACSLGSADQGNYDLTGRWGLGLGAGVDIVNGSDFYTENTLTTDEMEGNFVGGVWVRYHMTKRLAVELGYTRMVFDYAGTGSNNLDPALNLIDLNIAYRMFPTNRWKGLIQLGLGNAMITDINMPGVANTEDEDDFAAKLRVGPEFMATSDLMLSLYLDVHHVNMGEGDDSELVTLSPQFGLTYYFKGKKAKAVDTDGDGIADSKDKCPNTPTSVSVNVGSDGCPIAMDADGDGVSDADDKCPNTAAGATVTSFGCTKTQNLEFVLNVQFPVGSTKINPAYTSDLTQFAEFLKKYPNTTAVIEGHTDSTGGYNTNKRISQKRADSVRGYLVNTLGVTATQLTAKGFGPDKPVADNKTAAGRKKNRRVVARVKTESK